ncbi:hypothetical protein HBI56_227180 [Parastagonospora nodorum]|uniref:Glycoside hydrolase family 3 C-terminal domain-containing protein n=2 Tax=Phaeosphaeria nodorum (strain SN15 / ATCC MYA-4574 / FGSC 10173) TaxID=321614 RepID=A0A7U2HYU0_PHANO|nr:hypothetical protein SNOG_15834 [Parastagonospora nodorum SN15]KAH3903777.1 hypothetical protein HBH56_244650 [Parastagonospora nodorum]EAT76672.1 hypothetical protein SNOG_15834 [Parastagonospora nodorum SN15]KAH3921067.1 hypothetical protein HBH54_246450 [Parastagonospora nodorum]KAH3939490.1 hypothetical protein HBH53_234230 [Parastagonospora nodorum]KAH3959054.1 hypothetical protein HBH51_202230 [Parastagonospora nodorum]
MEPDIAALTTSFRTEEFPRTGATNDSVGVLLGVQHEERVLFKFKSSKPYDLVMETHPSPVNNAELTNLHPPWVLSQEEMKQNVLAKGTNLAQEADVAVVFVGNTKQWETEGQDLSFLTLPANGPHDRLITSVVAVNPIPSWSTSQASQSSYHG